MLRSSDTPWIYRLGEFVLAVWLLLGVISFSPFDPSLTNLRWPMGGLANWGGYAGAMVGGTLVELLGAAAVLVPSIWLLLVLFPRPVYLRLRLPAPIHLTLATLHLAGFLALVQASWQIWLTGSERAVMQSALTLQEASLTGGGILGSALAVFADYTTGVVLGGLFLLVGMTYSLTRLVAPRTLWRRIRLHTRRLWVFISKSASGASSKEALPPQTLATATASTAAATSTAPAASVGEVLPQAGLQNPAPRWTGVLPAAPTPVGQGAFERWFEPAAKEVGNGIQNPMNQSKPATPQPRLEDWFDGVQAAKDEDQ